MAVTGAGNGIYKMTAGADAVTGRLNVSYIRWVGGTTAGHSCVLDDSNGNVIFEGEADGANYTDIMPVFRWINGITVDTLDSGTVYVYTI